MILTKFVREPRTDADVRLLRDTFTDLLPDGRVIPHEAIEALLSLTRRQARYHTVTKHWRRAVWDEQRVRLDGRTALGKGFKALTPDEMIRSQTREVQAIGRRLKLALEIMATPHDSDLSEATRVARARILSGVEQIAVAHRRVLREINEALRPALQLPRAVNSAAEG